MEPLDLTRDVAEKVLKRAMAPLRKFLDSDQNTDEIPMDEPVTLTVGQVREMDKDLGALGIALATRYREQVEYQTALGVMAADNVRLHTALDELVTLAQGYKEEGDKLAGELGRAGAVKSQGFRAS